MFKRCYVNALILMGLTVPCAAQGAGSGIIEIPKELQAASAQCSQGVVYDTGSFTAGYIIGSGHPNDATMGDEIRPARRDHPGSSSLRLFSGLFPA